VPRYLCLLLLSVGLATCGGGSSPTTPSAPAVTTRIVALSGDLAFGEVDLGSSAERSFTIANSGNASLTISSLSAVGGTGTAAFTASWTSGMIAAGGTQVVTVRFTPTLAQYYSSVLTVVGNQTSGNPGINISGTGVNRTPLFTRSGIGDTVFDMPTTVRRVHIVGTYTGEGQNFIVWIGNDLLVNEILGTRWPQTVYDGTHVTTGGVVQVKSSTGVAWSFTEVR